MNGWSTKLELLDVYFQFFRIWDEFKVPSDWFLGEYPPFVFLSKKSSEELA